MIKLILTDYDGAYANQGGKVLAPARKLKEILQKRGVIISLVSGRSIKETNRFVKSENFSPIFIAELGAIIFYKGEEITNLGDPSKYKNNQSFIDYLHRTNSHDAIYKIGAVDLLLEKAKTKKEKLSIFTPKDGRPGGTKNNIMRKKGTVLLRGKIDLKSFNKSLSNNFPYLEIIDNGFIEIPNSDGTRDHAYHLVIKGANKYSAAKIIQKKLNCSYDETVAIGDSLADLELSKVCNKFILVKNPEIDPDVIVENFKRGIKASEAKKFSEKIIITKNCGSLGWVEGLEGVIK
ncbi:Cof-type HAD-IIB family hydrolase [Patescibacteria group bacterium]|nr:Cof-type HAD-IIB family hydrolase [Patescibacteria group bacterium]